MKAIINSEKRIFQLTLTSLLTGVAVNIDLIKVVQDIGTGVDAREVLPGTVIKAVYVELWYLGAAQQPTTMTTCIIKLPGDAPGPDADDLGSLNSYNNKKNILETHQGIVGDANANPIPAFRGWIKIPKGKQRFGLGDKLIVSNKSITEDTELCGVVIFKAYN